MYLYFTEYLEKAIFLYILCVGFADGLRDVDILVYGKDVVKTDIATYTIYNSNDVQDRTLTISCLSFLPVPTTISLFRNADTSFNGNFVDRTYTNNDNAVFIFEIFTSRDVTNLKGDYSCHFHSLLSAYDGSQFNIEKKIHINTTTEKEGCESSVGSYGFLGEKVTLFCVHFSYFLQLSFLQGQRLHLKSQLTMDVWLLERNNTLECRFSSSQEKPVCSLPLELYESFQVEILPTNFNLDSPLLNFTCKSTPPRMMYWEITGADENDFNITSHLLQAGYNITIRHEAGLSSLNISSAINKTVDPGIRKVVCYAHGTRIRSVSFATFDPIPNNTKECECNNSLSTYPSQNSFTSSETHEGISTMTEVTLRENTEEDDTVKFMPASTSTRPPSPVATNGGRNGKINDWKILCVSAIASCEALFLLIIAGVWIYRRCIRKKKEPIFKM